MTSRATGSPVRAILEAIALVVVAFVVSIVVHAIYNVVLLVLAYATI